MPPAHLADLPDSSSFSTAYWRMTSGNLYRAASPARLARTRDSSTSRERGSKTVPPPTSVSHTSSAASRVKPPENTARFRKRARSASSRRSWLQSIVARRVLWRSGAVRGPVARSPSASSRRAEIWAVVMLLTLDAASSMASGAPSSFRHTSATAGAFASTTSKPGEAAEARSAKSRGDSEREAASSDGESGTDMAGTGHILSPETPSGSRLVARTARCGHRRSNPSASLAHASTRCSQLSRRIKHPRSRRAAGSSRSISRPGRSPTPSTEAASRATSDGSLRGSNSTSQTPSGKAPPEIPAKLSSPAKLRAASSASRVLPEPPTPVSVRSRPGRTMPRTSSSSASRPTKLVSGSGRLP
ncbi:MAG: hypothetical protein M3494_12700 [Actinomycetota bacterium]|nr:hypothetical protein [Actinomycetota bacterium]